MRLSQAKIPTLLLIGNHDVSPSIGRAHALQEFKTLQVPFVKVWISLVFLIGRVMECSSANDCHTMDIPFRINGMK